jgi:hypothetical protein
LERRLELEQPGDLRRHDGDQAGRGVLDGSGEPLRGALSRRVRDQHDRTPGEQATRDHRKASDVGHRQAEQPAIIVAPAQILRAR